MEILSKPKPGSKNPPKPLSLSFTNLRSLRNKFDHIESFLQNSSPDIFAVGETNLNDSIDSSDFLVNGYLPLNRKDSTSHMLGLGVYVQENLPISHEKFLESPNHSFMCFRISLLHSTSYLFFLYCSPKSKSCIVIDSVSESIDKALVAHPSANIFIFGDFNIHHSEWLPFSGPTSEAAINTFNFAISQSLTQLVDFPTRFPDRSDHNPSLLDLFLSSHPDICRVSSSSPLGKSDHAVGNVEINLNVPGASDSPRHRTLYSFEHGDWDSFRDFVRDIP